MPTFNDLKKNAKKDTTGFAEVNFSLLGDTATQFLAQAIQGYAYLSHLRLNLFEADYNQIDAQVLDENSELYRSVPDYVALYMSAEKCYEAFCETALENRHDFAENYMAKIRGYWGCINQHRKCRILQFTFAEIDDGIFGNYAGKTPVSFLYQIRKLNLLLMDSAQECKNVYLIDLCSVQNLYGRNAVLDEKYLYSAKMALSLDILPHVAKQTVDVVDALRGKFKKCAVLDLDNTLWGGVIGDDGISNIQIGELGAGKAFTDLQRWLKQLKERGVLLAVCSKNNENTAKEPFEKHPDMVLRLDDISMFVANWDDKASNIRYIQQTLDLGMDSFVFLDDNPFERNMVRSLIPEIAVPELPEDPALYVSFLREQNLFETASYSDEDLKRTKQYQAEIGRAITQKNYASIDDYLISLEMLAEVRPFDSFQYPRIAQLTQRSNQFNLRTVRYTEAEIEETAKSDKYLTLYFTLRDKFGEHGLISVVILEKRPEQTLFVDTWLMSCRVLKRGMEEFIVNRMVESARANGFQKVVGEYLQTPKNAMVADIYEKLGFQRINESRFTADVNTFKQNKTYIEEKSE